MTGAQLRAHLEERIRAHQDDIARLTPPSRPPDRALERWPSDSAVDGEIRRAERRIDVLTFIRDYIVADEVYRLGEFDLRFADLLPDDDWDDDVWCPAPEPREGTP